MRQDNKKRKGAGHKRKKGNVLRDYRPEEREEYMSEAQLAYFESKLLNWRQELLDEVLAGRRGLQENQLRLPDFFDTASSQTDLSIDLSGLQRQKTKLSLIDRALLRIENREYGYCEITGEPIGLRRLEARPVATLSVEAQELLERKSATAGNRFQASSAIF